MSGTGSFRWDVMSSTSPRRIAVLVVAAALAALVAATTASAAFSPGARKQLTAIVKK